MSNFSLHLIDVTSQEAIKMAGVETIEQDKLFGLIRSIAQMGQTIGTSGIVNIELQNDRVFAFTDTTNKDNLLLLIVPISSDKDKIYKKFEKFLNAIFKPKNNLFVDALNGSSDAYKKSQQISSKYFKQMNISYNQSRMPFTLNFIIGLITTFAIAELVIALPMLLSENAYSWYGNFSTTFSSSLAFIFLTIVAFKYGLKSESGRVWFLLGIAFFFMTVAEITWAILDLFLHQDPYPSLADAFWIIGYIIMLVALILEDRQVKIPRNIVLTIIWSLVLIGAGLAIYFTLAEDIYLYEDYNFLEKSVSTFYVFWDIILIFVLGLIFFKYRQGKIGVSWLLIMLGIVITAAADIMFSYLDWNEIYEQYQNYNDVMFVTGYYLIAIAGVLHLRTLIDEELLNK
ncbi:MAG: YfhO family protein [Asgard group archaeon]|nr:YfhO family protein [Asgard group archaeon]